jgi:hypothetical protein
MVVDRYLEKTEKSLGCWGAGVLLGLCTLVIAAIYVRPGFSCLD